MGSQTRIPPGPSTRVMALRPGDPRRVGGYRLTGLLGEGGMGQVFLGRSRAGRMVAVKLIRPEYARQPAFRERFARAVGAMTLTTAGTMLGTCLYMSPEQMREASLTAASDIFSLRAVLTFAATGAPPFRATTLPGIVRDITDGAPDLADVPDPLVPLIAACLAKDPAARPGLDDILTRCAALGRRPAPPRKPVPRKPVPRKPPPSPSLVPSHVVPSYLVPPDRGPARR